MEMKDHPDTVDEMFEALLTLTDFWAERDYPMHSPHTVQGRGNSISPADYYNLDNYRNILESHRQWAAREEVILRQRTVRTP